MSIAAVTISAEMIRRAGPGGRGPRGPRPWWVLVALLVLAGALAEAGFMLWEVFG